MSDTTLVFECFVQSVAQSIDNNITFVRGMSKIPAGNRLRCGFVCRLAIQQIQHSRSYACYQRIATRDWPLATVPPLTGINLDTVREAVIASMRPAVVQVNVVTQGGGAIGSGVIDRRGYIVTNNHVVDGAQAIQVVLYDGTKLLA